MSLILDALKKLERERMARNSESQGLRPSLLRDRQPQQQNRRWPVVVILSSLLLTLAGALFFLRPTDKKPAMAAVAPLPTPPTPQAPLPPATMRPAVPLPVPEPVEPVTMTPEQPALVSNLTVSGIAWQEEHRLRRAVVNGLLVKEGETVEGALVVEIRQDRVRFDSNGQRVEALLQGVNAGR
jgi:general secretion pathway protein B